MKLRKLVRPILVVVILAGAGVGATMSYDSWKTHVFPQPATKAAGAAEPGKDKEEEKNHVTLSDQAIRNLHLDAQQPEQKEYWRTILLPGSVVDWPGVSDRGVTSRVAGLVTGIKARPGDVVKPGDPLFTLVLVSESLQTAQSNLFNASRELQIAVAKRDRVAKQVEARTTAGTVLIEEENQVKRITTQLQGHRRHLQVLGFTPEQVSRAESGDVVTEITIFAPFPVDGHDLAVSTSSTEPREPRCEVQDLKVRMGDQVQPGQALCTLADHQRLLVEGWAFKSEAKSLAIAAEKRVPIRVEFTDEHHGDWSPVEPLLIHHLSNQVDPVSRTFSFFLTIDNQAQTFTREGKTFYVWRFRPGQRVRLRIPVEKLSTPGSDGKTEILPFVMPAGAVVREGPEAFVFRQNGNVFVRKPVHVLYEDRIEVVIANDGSITDADWIVQNDAAAINRALKSGGGDAEGHDH